MVLITDLGPVSPRLAYLNKVRRQQRRDNRKPHISISFRHNNILYYRSFRNSSSSLYKFITLTEFPAQNAKSVSEGLSEAFATAYATAKQIPAYIGKFLRADWNFMWNKISEVDYDQFLSEEFDWIKNNVYDIGATMQNIGNSIVATTENFMKYLFKIAANAFGYQVDALMQELVMMVWRQMVNNVKTAIQRFDETMTKKVLVVLAFLCIAACVWYIPKDKMGFGMKALTILGSAICAYAGNLFPMTLITFVLTHLLGTTPPNKAEAQGPGMKEDLKTIFSNTLYCAAFFGASTQGVDLNLDEKNVEKLMRKTILSGKCLETWDKLFDKASSLVEDIFAFVYRHFTNVPYTRSDIAMDVEIWTKEVMELCTFANQSKVGKDPDTNDTVERLYIEYLQLRSRYGLHRKMADIINITAQPLIQMWRLCLTKNTSNHCMRSEPICTLFKGASGIGKSYLLSLLQQDLLKICGKFDPKKHIENLVYARAAEQEFWDGYVGQPIVIVDDFGQKKDSQANPNIEFFELIRMINIFPYNLHMASLVDKASTAFLSKFVVLTSNLPNIKAESIHENAALIRRIHLDIDTKILPEVTTRGKLDLEKLKEYRQRRNLRSTDTSHYRFSINGAQESLDYTQLLCIISETYRRHEDVFEQRQEDAKETANDKLPPGVWSTDAKWISEEIPEQEEEQEWEENFEAVFLDRGSFQWIEYYNRFLEAQDVDGMMYLNGEELFVNFVLDRFSIAELDELLLGNPVRRSNYTLYERFELFFNNNQAWAEAHMEGGAFVGEVYMRYNLFMRQRPAWRMQYLQAGGSLMWDDFAEPYVEEPHIFDTLEEYLTRPHDYIRGYQIIEGGTVRRWLTKLARRNQDFDEDAFKQTLRDLADKANEHARNDPQARENQQQRRDERRQGRPARGPWEGEERERPRLWSDVIRDWIAAIKNFWCDVWHVLRNSDCANILILGGIAIGVGFLMWWHFNDASLGPTWDEASLTTKLLRFRGWTDPMFLPSRIAGFLLQHRRFHWKYGIEKCDRCNEAKTRAEALDAMPVPTIPREFPEDRLTPYEKKWDTFTPEQHAKYYFKENGEQKIMGAINMRLMNEAPWDEGNLAAEFETLKKVSEGCKSTGDADEQSRSRKSTEGCKSTGDADEQSRSRKSTEAESIKTLKTVLTMKDLFGKHEACDVEGCCKECEFCNNLPCDCDVAAAEGPLSTQASELITSIRKNMRILFLEVRTPKNEPLRRYKLGQFMMVKGYKALINHHYVEKLKYYVNKELLENIENQVVLQIVDPAFLGSHPMSVSAFIKQEKPYVPRGKNIRGEVNNTELRVWTVPSSLNMGKNILPHIIKAKELARLDTSTRLMMATYNNAENTPETREGVYKRMEAVDISYMGADGVTKETTYPQVGTADISSAPGDCGAPYVINSDMFVRKILGFHVAGAKGDANFCFVTHDDLEPLVRHEVSQAQGSLVVEQYKPDDFPLDGAFHYIGKIAEPIYQPMQTKKRKSVIFNEVIENTYFPSKMAPPLLPGGPMIMGLMKNAGAPIPVDEDLLDEVVVSYQQRLDECTVHERDVRILSFEEGCQGIEGDKAYAPVKRSKSAGFPYSQRASGKGKSDWLGTDTWTFDTKAAKELRSDVEKIITEASQGIVSEVYFVDTLKDELRPAEKVKAGKTRVFSAASLSFTIAVRMYFLGFIAHLNRNKIISECAVGIDCRSRDWATLAHYLTQRSDLCIAGDFSNFDGSVNYWIFMRVLDIVNAFYADGKKNALIRRCLWENIVHARHIVGDQVYAVSQGQPSGNPLTAVTNTIYNSLATRYCYGLIMGSALHFDKNIRMQAYGDDNVIVVSEKIREKLTPRELSRAFSTIGMTYTSELKGQQSADFRSLLEITFLRRGFVEEDQYWWAPLDLESIAKSINWITKSPSPLNETVENCYGAIEELAYHPKATYDSLTTNITISLRQKGRAITAPAWKTMRRMILAGTLGDWREGQRSYV